MKTRILLFSALVLIFSSCQNMRYGHVPKVKAKKQVVQAKKEPAKKNLAATELIEVKQPRAVATVAPEATIKTAEFLQLPTAIVTAAAKEPGVLAAPRSADKKDDARAVLTPRKMKKLLKEEKQQATDDVKASRSWLWYIIIGLIFLLLAAIIVWPFGWIFYLVGVIAIIFGLLALIGVV